MSHTNKKSLYQQVVETLEAKARYGHSKHADKRAGVTDQYIYSFDTMATYKKAALRFTDWVKSDPVVVEALGRKPRTLVEIRPFAEMWLLKRQDEGKSAYTLKMERSALKKLYGEEIYVELKPAKRTDISRSRGTAARDAGFSEKKNAELINFCRCCGPRRAELAMLDASALEFVGGKPFVHYTKGTKGGRERLSPIVGTEDEVKRALVYLDSLDGTQKINSHADIHSYRADYATRVYMEAARPIEELRGKMIDVTSLSGKDGRAMWRSAIYCFRGDRKGDKLDRAAMLKASQALGHNRVSVVAESYIRV
ncbi:MAG: hypothetical protein IKH31_00465 [Clostridia bacterium]|nr:hypothetical protein [Clostridia bacterium]